MDASSIASFNMFYGKMWVGFCLSEEKSLFVDVSF